MYDAVAPRVGEAIKAGVEALAPTVEGLAGRYPAVFGPRFGVVEDNTIVGNVAEGATISPVGHVDPQVPGTAIKTYWPANGGFLRQPVPQTLDVGYQFSRYGGFFEESGAFKDYGSYVAPFDVPYKR